MSQFGYGIIPQLFQSGLGYSGQATSLNQSWTNAALQNSAQQAALAEARRRALEQEKIQREQIDAQKDAQKDAQTSQWINMGIGAGTGAAAGGILGGLAAAPAGAALGGTAPAAAASAPPIMSPTGIATTQAAAAGPMSQGVPFTGSIGMPDPRLSGGGGIGGMSPPQFQPFAGGNRAAGAGYGALLGGATGQNFLGPALQMPYQNALTSGRLGVMGSQEAQNWAQTALVNSQRDTENAMRQPQVDTETQRGKSYGALADSRLAETNQTNTLTPLKATTERNRGSKEAELGNLAKARATSEETMLPYDVFNSLARTDNSLSGADANAARAESTRKMLPGAMQLQDARTGAANASAKRGSQIGLDLDENQVAQIDNMFANAKPSDPYIQDAINNIWDSAISKASPDQQASFIMNLRKRGMPLPVRRQNTLSLLMGQ